MEPLPVGMTAVPLAGIVNDRDTSISYLRLMLNARAAVRGVYVETDIDAGNDRKVASKNVYWLEGIESREGIVLGGGQGVKAILLQGDIDSEGGRGSLVIKYLTNGLFMNYAECRVLLRRVSSHDWKLVNAYNGRLINRVEVRTWLLGISTLANVCPEAAS
jgi:hypothetical protein